MMADAAQVQNDLPFQRRVLRFQVVSPVHIGTREGRLLPMEFMFTPNRVHLIDEDKFGQFLKARGVQLIDSFVQAAGKGELSKGLEQFLKEKAGVPAAQLSQLAERISNYHVDGGSSDMQEFRPFVRDGFGRVYIPGTSLKGVFRTAVLYGILRGDNTQKESLEQQVQTEVNNLAAAGKRKENVKKFLSQQVLQEQLLQHFKLSTAKQPQNRDLLRCLKVRDAYPVEGTCKTQVVKIEFLSKRKTGSFYWSKQKRWDHAMGTHVDLDKPLCIWVEAIVEGLFETEVLWDDGLFAMFRQENKAAKLWPMTGLEDLFMASSNMYRDLIKHEKDFFAGGGEAAGQNLQKWYGGLDGDMLRIGFGSGMLGTTVNRLWSEKLRQRIRNECGHPRHDDPAPKSRRVWMCGANDWRPMGWVRIIGQEESIEEVVQGLKQKAAAATSPAGSPNQPVMVPRVPRPKVTPLAEEKPTVKGLLDQARSIRLEDTMNLERLVQTLDELDPADAHSVASILKQRLSETGRWKKHPLRQDIEMFVQS
jgi:CRISPR-associated protein Csm5